MFINQSIERFNPVTGGAVSTVVHNVAMGLQQLGHEVLVATTEDTHSSYDDVGTVAISFPENRTPLIRRKLIGIERRLHHYDYHMYGQYIRQLRRTIEESRFNPDVFLFHNDLHLTKFLARWYPKVPRVIWLHNDVHTNLTNPSEYLAQAHQVVAVSQFIKNSALRRFSLSPDRVQVILNGVDLHLFSPEGTEGSDLESGAKPIKVVFAGRLIYDKGADLIVDAVRQLQLEGLPLTVSIAGSVTWDRKGDDSDPYLKRKILPALRDCQGEWLPHQPRWTVPELLRSSDIAVIPSRFPDPCPLAAIESLASGCAVIASNTGGLPEILDGCGTLIEPGSLPSLTDALRQLSTNRGLMTQRKQMARNRALQMSWSTTTGRLLEVVENARSIAFNQAEAK